jgi:hypothetical protein
VKARRWRGDGAVALAVGALAAGYHLVVSATAMPGGADLPLFGADTARVLRHMAVRGPMLDRGQFHPLFPLLTQPPMRVLQALGLDRLDAAHVVMAAAGGVLAAAVYGTGRRRRLGRVDALAPAALATVAAASTVYFSIPETFGVSAALAAVVIYLVAGWRSRPPMVEAVAVLVLGGAAVVLGALAPLVAVFGAERRWSRRAAIIGAAIAVAAGALLVQAVLFGTRINLTASGEGEFVRTDRLGGAADSLRTLVVSTWALPPARIANGTVTVRAAPWPTGVLTVVTMIALAALWALAAVGVWRRRHDALVPVLLVALVAHVALFALYGDEGFLYAAPLLPLVTGLVVVAAVSEVRRPLIATCWALVPLLALVNVPAVHDIGGLIGR